MTTIAKRLYSGSGWPLTNGSGLPITVQTDVGDLAQATYDLLTEIRAVLGGPGSTVVQMLGATDTQVQQVKTYAQGAMLLGGVAALVQPEVGIPVALAGEVLNFLATQEWGGDVDLPSDMPQNTVKRIVSGDAPVTPITPPPAGYGGTGATAAQVWQYPASGADGVNGQYATTALGVLQYAGWLASLLSYTQGVVDPRNPYFSLVARNAGVLTEVGFNGWQGNTRPSVPALDLSAVLPGDTVLSYLQREVGAYAWSTSGPWGEASPAGVYAQLAAPYSTLWWRCNLTNDQLQLLAGNLSSGGGDPVPPIWPGLASVTLGEPVAVTENATIPGPLDGIIATLLVPPSGLSKHIVEGFTSYWRLGLVAFVSDNGQVENWQYLQWNDAVYCPKALRRADSALLELQATCEMTVTPWTRNT